MPHVTRKLALFSFGALALATNTATCNTNVLLDDFNNGDFAGWTVHSGTWIVTNGTLVGHRTSPGLDAYIYTGDTNWSDFIFETDLRFQDGNAEILFRSTGRDTDEYRLGLWSQGAEAYSNRFHLIEYNNGISTFHTSSLPNQDGNAMSPVPITETAHLKIEAIGSLLSFYINDSLMYQLTDPSPIQNGRVRLGVIWNWTDGFDNVSVELVPEVGSLWVGLSAAAILFVIRRMRPRNRRQPKGTLRP